MILISSDKKYREVIQYIQSRDDIYGVLITSHKIKFFNTCNFSYLDTYATRLHEISTIVKQNNDLHGYAQDTLASGKMLTQIWETYSNYSIKTIVLIGSGGAAIAFCDFLCNSNMGERIMNCINLFVVEKNKKKLANIKSIFSNTPHDISYQLAQSKKELGEVINGINSTAIIINATGMGKDTPGSPLPQKQKFSYGSILWDLNYRGDLKFLKNAAQYNTNTTIHLEDGWQLAVYGWLHVLEKIEGKSIFANTSLVQILLNTAYKTRKLLEKNY